MKLCCLMLMLATLTPPSISQRADQRESLLIGPGDLLHIQVFQTPDLEQHLRVTDHGTIELLTGDSIAVDHLSPNEAAHVIEREMVSRNWMLSPHVMVTVEQYATQGVTIFGQVKTPGVYPIETSRSLLDVISLAGGLTDFANREITIKRWLTKEDVTYFVSNESKLALDSAPQVYPGDSILVPKADVVYALGDVGRPGAYVNATNDGKLTVLQIISQAGSTPPNAVPSKAIIIRKQSEGTYVKLPLPLAAMQKGKLPDIVLQANDVIYVPFSYLRNVAVDLGGLAAAAASSAVYVAR